MGVPEKCGKQDGRVERQLIFSSSVISEIRLSIRFSSSSRVSLNGYGCPVTRYTIRETISSAVSLFITGGFATKLSHLDLITEVCNWQLFLQVASWKSITLQHSIAAACLTSRGVPELSFISGWHSGADSAAGWHPSGAIPLPVASCSSVSPTDCTEFDQNSHWGVIYLLFLTYEDNGLQKY